MDRISRLKKKETNLVSRGNKAVDEGREQKADRLLRKADRIGSRTVKLENKKTLPKAQKGLGVGGGSYVVFDNGRVGRTTPSYAGNLGTGITYESMDTTGYSKGKKNFVVKQNPISSSGAKIINASATETISRKDVPAKIAELKKGSTRVIDTRKKPKKAKARPGKS